MTVYGGPYRLYTSLDGHQVFDRFGCRALLAWLSTRVLRGGSRLIVQVALCLLGIVFLTRALPKRAADVALARGYGALWKWAGSGTGSSPVVDDGSVAGGLRVVVFGASDIATIPDSDGTGDTTWFEVMCSELDCSSYISLAPKSPSRSLTSNSLYAGALQEVASSPNRVDPPGYNYSFYPALYPVPWELPDFGNQVADFLSRARPRHAPKETLWVVNFGHWDIWSLAALPLSVGASVVDAMVADIVGNIEKLYQASMDETSIAHSNFTLHTTTAVANATAERSTAELVGKTRPAVVVDGGARHVMAEQQDDTEVFRIIVPMIFDQTLMPGWRTDRPDIPSVHSKAEQMRNAATLTERWNRQLQNATEFWVRTQNPKPPGGEGREGQSPGSPSSGTTARFTSDPIAPRPAPTQAADAPSPSLVVTSGASVQPKQPENSTAAAPPTRIYPLRDAIIYDLQEYLTEIIVERQLRNIQYVDQNGIGGKPESVGFRDVTVPCVRLAQAAGGPSTRPRQQQEEKPGQSRHPCGDVAKHEGGGCETKKQDGKTNKSTPTSSIRKSIRSMSSSSRRRRRSAAPADTSSPQRQAEAAETRPPTHTAAVVVVESRPLCDMPRDHLWFTSLTLSPRAIDEVGREVADLVMRNLTLRGYWGSLGRG